MQIEKAKIEDYVFRLNAKFQKFRAKAAQMVESHQRLKAVYPGFQNLFCASDDTFSMDGQGYCQRLEQSRVETNKKYSLYLTTANQNKPRLAKNKSMNVGVFEGVYFDSNAKRLSIEGSKKTFPAGGALPRGDFLGPRTQAREAQRPVKKSCQLPRVGLRSTIKVSVVLSTGSTTQMQEATDNQQQPGVLSAAQKSPCCTAKSRISIDLRSEEGILSMGSLVSKPVLKQQKTRLASEQKSWPGCKNKGQVKTYAQLIEKTGRFNVVPDITRHPVYAQFQRKLHEVLGSPPGRLSQPNAKAVSIRSSVFNLRIQHQSTGAGALDFGSRVLCRKANQHSAARRKDSLSVEGKAWRNPLGSSVFLNAQSANEKGLSSKNSVPDDARGVIDFLKNQGIFWETLVPKAKIEALVEQLDVRQCELVFLELVFVFKSDLSNAVPRFGRLVRKLQSKALGETDQSPPAC